MLATKSVKLRGSHTLSMTDAGGDLFLDDCSLHSSPLISLTSSCRPANLLLTGACGVRHLSPAVILHHVILMNVDFELKGLLSGYYLRAQIYKMLLLFTIECRKE